MCRYLESVENRQLYELPWWFSINNLPAMQETQLQFVDRDDPPEEDIAIHSSILAWEIPWTQEPGGPKSMCPKRAGHDWAHMHSLKKWLHLQKTFPPCCSMECAHLGWRPKRGMTVLSLPPGFQFLSSDKAAVRLPMKTQGGNFKPGLGEVSPT